MSDRNPIPPNPPVKTADEIMQAIMFDIGVQAVIVYATGQLPWLGLPLISTIFRAMVVKVTSLLYNVLEQFVAFQIIEAQISGQKEQYYTAVTQLEQAQASGDANALAKATANYSNTLSALLHFVV